MKITYIVVITSHKPNIYACIGVSFSSCETSSFQLWFLSVMMKKQTKQNKQTLVEWKLRNKWEKRWVREKKENNEAEEMVFEICQRMISIFG